MFALYRGTSIISKLIECRTWSDYSHVSWIDKNDWEYEAWQNGGVCYVPFGANHTAGTVVDLYDFKAQKKPQELDALEEYFKSQLGKKYDYMGVFGFLWVGRLFGIRHKRNALFCSEYMSEGCIRILDPINGKPSYKVPPDDFSTSNILTHKGSRTVHKHQGDVPLK